MVEVFEWVFFSKVPSHDAFLNVSKIGGARQVPNLHVLLDSVSNLNDSTSGAWDVAFNVEETPVMVYSYNPLVQHRGVPVAELACHLLALPDFARILALADGPWQSVSLRVTVTRLLTTEVPPLHCALVALSFGDSLHVHKLAWFEVAWPEHEANRKQVLRSDLELTQEGLWRQTMLQEMASIGLQQLLHSLLSDADLERIEPVLRLLYLSHLAPVDLDHRARHMLTPSVPELSHANLESKDSSPSRVHVDGLCLLDIEVLVDGVFERPVRVALHTHAIFLRTDLAVINNHVLRAVCITHVVQLLHRERLRHRGCEPTS